ncbi:MAG: preprotein translocase subunit YajC [Deltaproteobacteria bacterium]|nr:preprotein translocase subunit YajC [Deltaproteobacteria bacterium]
MKSQRHVTIIALFTAVLVATLLPACAQMPTAGQEGQAGGSNVFGLLLPLLLTFGIFYFLLVRPQQRQAKSRQEMLKALKKGDEIVTSGGLHGKIIAITDKVVTLEVADLGGQKIRLRYDRDQIGRQEKSTEE